MAEFVYNNAKNASINHTIFELNCILNPQVLFEGKVNSYSRSHLANKLADKFKELIEICCQNLLYT